MNMNSAPQEAVDWFARHVWGQGVAYRNLMLTMLIGGLWHGASWTFAAWGAYHGGLLCLYRAYSDIWDRIAAKVSQVLMFVLVLVGWVFFRSTDFTMAWTLLGKLFSPAQGVWGSAALQIVIALFIARWWAMAGPNAFDMHQNWRFRRRHAIAWRRHSGPASRS